MRMIVEGSELEPCLLHKAIEAQENLVIEMSRRGRAAKVKRRDERTLPLFVEKEIYRAATSGEYTRVEIAEKFGVARSTVTTIAGSDANYCNTKRGGVFKKLSDAMIARMRDDRAEGMRMQDIATRHGVSLSAVSKYCRRVP